jgi:glycosyltransferase involved in cell wall biosynthesis
VKYSVIVPVYENELSIQKLLENLRDLSGKLNDEVEVIFVVDGSKDQSFKLLKEALPQLNYPAKLVCHSKNLGAFTSIKTGMKQTDSGFSVTYSADCQEPISLVEEIFATLGKNKIDVVFGIRSSRQDPIISQILSKIFWFIYRLLIDRDMPKGGVDIFGCNSIFRTELVQLNETRSSLVGLAFWLGFERGFVKYDRLTREKGKSSWTISKKINYFLDTLYSFTDLPIRILIFVGGISILFSVIFASIIAIFRVYGLIEVPGYTATILMIVFFGGLNMFGLGIVGNYTWRVYENSKNRPTEIISRVYTNGK